MFLETYCNFPCEEKWIEAFIFFQTHLQFLLLLFPLFLQQQLWNINLHAVTLMFDKSSPSVG